MKPIYLIVNIFFIIALFPLYLFYRPNIKAVIRIVTEAKKTGGQFYFTPEQAVAREFGHFYFNCMCKPLEIHEVKLTDSRFIK